MTKKRKPAGNDMSRKRLRAVIVDDEPLARRFIRRLLKEDCDFEIAGECANSTEAVATIKKSKPDIAFLDVQMPEMDGFAVLRALGNQLPELIFTTAYQEHAIRAFELHALDYLLKPFGPARFRNAIKHAKERLRERSGTEREAQIGALLDSINRQAEYLERLVVRADGRITFLRTRELDWIEADDKYVHLHSGKSARILRQTITAMEGQLDPRRFVRIHRSAIVNVERIKELLPLFTGEHSIVLEDGTKLTVSRTYKDKFFAVIGKPI